MEAKLKLVSYIREMTETEEEDRIGSDKMNERWTEIEDNEIEIPTIASSSL